MAESYNLCLDIGGTKVLGVVFNSKKEIVYRLKKKTKAGGDSSENVEEVIINVAKDLIDGLSFSHQISRGETTTSESPLRRSSVVLSISVMTLMSVYLVSISTAQLKATRMLSAFLSAQAWAAD